MTPQEVKRKLAAILSADVKGYSRLMGEDEEGTIRTLNVYKEVITGFVQKHQGRLVGTAGDSMLAEFASVVDAVRCAVGIQEELKDRNKELSEDRRMEFRIGVNLGDVVEDGDTIYGDGVNIAARLENLSDAGGICISGTAYDQVENKLSLGYEYLGEQAVKNIAKPVRVYRVLMEPGAAGKVIGEKGVKPRQWRMATIGLVVAGIVVVATVVIWKLYTPSAPQPEVAPKGKTVATQPEKPSVTTPPSPEVVPKEKLVPSSPEKVTKPAPPPAPKMEVASKEKMALPLPDKPSIAVLPFTNMSGDPQQEYFSDGITEEIITALSKVPRLFVIARNSTFTYKGKPVKVKQVAEEMGVRYVLEGSVRKTEGKVRITTQLIDALTGHHLWAEKYDRDLKDIFAIQDEISFKVVTALQVKLTDGEQALTYAGGTKNFEAYARYLKGADYVKRINKEGNLLARKMAEETIALDPNYPRGYRLLAMTHWLDVRLGLSKDPKQSLTESVRLYQKTLAMDPSDGSARVLLGFVFTIMRQYEKGMAEADQGVAISPNASIAHIYHGYILIFNGMHKEAIEAIKKAIRLDPLPPDFYWRCLGQAYCHVGMYEEAIAASKEALRRYPDAILTHVLLAQVYALSGREKEARAEVEEVLRINSRYSVEFFRSSTPYKNPADMELMANALLKAGVPKTPPDPK
jgi:TolB-like protein/class 3 adenylate cyclase